MAHTFRGFEVQIRPKAVEIGGSSFGLERMEIPHVCAPLRGDDGCMGGINRPLEEGA